MTKHFLETVSDPGKPHLYHVAARLCILSPRLTFASEPPLFPFDFAFAQPANEIVMAPKRKSQNSAAAIIPLIDFNSQLPFTGNHMSVVSELELLPWLLANKDSLIRSLQDGSYRPNPVRRVEMPKAGARFTAFTSGFYHEETFHYRTACDFCHCRKRTVLH